MNDDQCQAADPTTERPLCDHICLKDDGHVERGEPHFYGYEHPSPRAALPSEGWEQVGKRHAEFHYLFTDSLTPLDDWEPVYRRVDGAAPPEPERQAADELTALWDGPDYLPDDRARIGQAITDWLGVADLRAEHRPAFAWHVAHVENLIDAVLAALSGQQDTTEAPK